MQKMRKTFFSDVAHYFSFDYLFVEQIFARIQDKGVVLSSLLCQYPKD